MQLALQAQPIRPAPQVIEIETRGLPVHDALGIDEIMIAAGFQLKKDQVLGGRHPDRQSFDGPAWPSAGPRRRRPERQSRSKAARLVETNSAAA